MPEVHELKAERFFASRSGVCVYVVVGTRAFRVQFASVDSRGVVVEGGTEGAEEACRIARHAMQQHLTGLAPLFEKVARATT